MKGVFHQAQPCVFQHGLPARSEYDQHIRYHDQPRPFPHDTRACPCPGNTPCKPGILGTTTGGPVPSRCSAVPHHPSDQPPCVSAPPPCTRSRVRHALPPLSARHAPAGRGRLPRPLHAGPPHRGHEGRELPPASARERLPAAAAAAAGQRRTRAVPACPTEGAGAITQRQLQALPLIPLSQTRAQLTRNPTGRTARASALEERETHRPSRHTHLTPHAQRETQGACRLSGFVGDRRRPRC